jgi:glycosyltransferase involved in cell wall biosynthesis
VLPRMSTLLANSSYRIRHPRTFCAEHGLDNVVFTGFVNQSELPSLYGASDLFVLASEHDASHNQWEHWYVR